MIHSQQAPTIEEFLQWPEQKPYLEYIHGTVRQKARPDQYHSRVQSKLTVMLYPWSEAQGGWTQTEQRCVLEAEGETETMLPDVAWWSRDQLSELSEGPVHVAPTLAVEILSPDDRYGEVQDKVVVYLNAGVAVVWVVDPRSRNVTVYRPSRAPRVVTHPERLQDDALPGLQVSLAELFDRLPSADTRPRVQE